MYGRILCWRIRRKFGGNNCDEVSKALREGKKHDVETCVKCSAWNFTNKVLNRLIYEME